MDNLVKAYLQQSCQVRKTGLQSLTKQTFWWISGSYFLMTFGYFKNSFLCLFCKEVQSSKLKIKKKINGDYYFWLSKGFIECFSILGVSISQWRIFSSQRWFVPIYVIYVYCCRLNLKRSLRPPKILWFLVQLS